MEGRRKRKGKMETIAMLAFVILSCILIGSLFAGLIASKVFRLSDEEKGILEEMIRRKENRF